MAADAFRRDLRPSASIYVHLRFERASGATGPERSRRAASVPARLAERPRTERIRAVRRADRVTVFPERELRREPDVLQAPAADGEEAGRARRGDAELPEIGERAERRRAALVDDAPRRDRTDAGH